MGMQTEVEILTRETIGTADGQADYWPPTGPTYLGWVFSEPSPLIIVNAGEQALANTYRLFLPVGTAVTSGDHARIEGNMFTVSDTIVESTWKPLLRCSLRRLE